MFRTDSVATVFMVLALSLTPNIAPAQSSTVESKRDATGIITANRTVALSAKITGRIEQIGFEEGEKGVGRMFQKILVGVDGSADLDSDGGWQSGA